jgi:HAE1 family hydrophobic/amphiphilic exporter-1
LHRLAALSLKNRPVVILLTLLLAVAGTIGISRLQSELLPDFELPIVTVITTYPGAGPTDVDAQLSDPISQAIAGLPGVADVQTTSSEGFSVVIAEFEFGEDMNARQDDVRRAVEAAQLPAEAGDPQVERISFNQFPIVQVSLSSETLSLSELRELAVNEYVPVIASGNGINRVDVIGGSDSMLAIQLDPARLTETGVTPQQVVSAMQANNLSVPVGAIESAEGTLPVRISSELTTVESLNALIVGASGEGENAEPVTLGSIATIEVVETPGTGLALMDGSPSVSLDIYMSQGSNTVDSATVAREKLDEVNEEMAAAGTDVTATTILDQSIFIEDSIDTLVREAVLGAVFAVLVILAFLMSVRSTLVTAISIPLSMLVAFLLLWWQGISLNIMTLGGLAVAVGRVVDDSIVVLESIYRHVQKGEDTKTATLEGTKEVALAITASTLTTVAVFLPLALVGGLIGEIFQPFALTVTFSLLASLLVSLTIVPVLSSYFISRDKVRPVKTDGTFLTRAYEPALKWALSKPVWTLLIALVLLVGSFGLVPFIGTSFIPSMGDKSAMITIDLPPGSSQDATIEQASALEAVVRENSEVESVQIQVGGDGLAAAFTGAANNRATMTVVFDEEVNLDVTLETLRTKLTAAAGADASVMVENAASAGTGGSGVELVITGEDYALVSDVANQLTEQVKGVENVTNVTNDVVGAKPELLVTVDPQAAAANGTSTAQIAQTVGEALNGVPAGTITIDQQPLTAQIVITGASDAETLAQLPVAGGGSVTLADVATVEEREGPTEINRIGGDRSATVSGVITSQETGTVIADVDKIVADFNVPDGVEIGAGGIAQDQGEAFTSMLYAILFAIAAVYIVMVASFGSLTTPFVILFSLPLAIIGVLLALFLSGKTLGLPAMIGLLMLVGIVVTNAIVLLEFVIELRHRGYELKDALIEGGKTRVRPILMTAIATILALTPLALSNEGGALIASDLAVVVIGGLLTSTLLTLFVVPVIYELIARWQDRRGKVKKIEPVADEAGVPAVEAQQI